MLRCCLSGVAMLLLVCHGVVLADDAVFSGPQVGEALPSFEAKGVFGDIADKEIDLIKRADGKPVALIFFHKRTRPAFGLTNSIMKYAVDRWNDKLETGVIFLTDDATSEVKWMRNVQQHFAKGVNHVVSTDGPEGPGSYGLNRNVELTVLIGKEGKVTANFALVQPSLQSDGPKIMKAIVDATGGGKVPALAEYAGRRYQGQNQTRKKTRDAKDNAKRQ